MHQRHKHTSSRSSECFNWVMVKSTKGNPHPTTKHCVRAAPLTCQRYYATTDRPVASQHNRHTQTQSQVVKTKPDGFDLAAASSAPVPWLPKSHIFQSIQGWYLENGPLTHSLSESHLSDTVNEAFLHCFLTMSHFILFIPLTVF